ncbi:hypothetical protein JCM10003_809 [Bacteroides pyogenes JCM 10003]|nr:hypothetical protein JCM10003_809 [Bacteroides pyogenes JCM 10003]
MVVHEEQLPEVPDLPDMRGEEISEEQLMLLSPNCRMVAALYSIFMYLKRGLTKR